jgi:hypothetical protein
VTNAYVARNPGVGEAGTKRGDYGDADTFLRELARDDATGELSED